MMPKFATDYRISDGITYSRLTDFMRCRQLCEYRLNGWRDPTRKPALAYGSLVHECLEVNAKGGNWVDVIREHLEAAQDEKEVDLISKAQIVLEGYFQYWKTHLELVEVEKQVDVLWEGYRLRGRRDAVVEVGGDHFLFETKTSARIAEGTIEEALQLDMQDMVYALLWEVEHREKLIGAIRNIIRRPGIVLKNLRADIQKRPEHYYQRYQVIFTEERMDLFKKEFRKKLTAFRRWCQGKESTYRNELSCHMPWRCEFVDACTTGTMIGFVQETERFKERRDAQEGNSNGGR